MRGREALAQREGKLDRGSSDGAEGHGSGARPGELPHPPRLEGAKLWAGWPYCTVLPSRGETRGHPPSLSGAWLGSGPSSASSCGRPLQAKWPHRASVGAPPSPAFASVPSSCFGGGGEKVTSEGRGTPCRSSSRAKPPPHLQLAGLLRGRAIARSVGVCRYGEGERGRGEPPSPGQCWASRGGLLWIF